MESGGMLEMLASLLMLWIRYENTGKDSAKGGLIKTFLSTL